MSQHIDEVIQLWKRIINRFQSSAVWKSAPAESLAVEALSLIRLAAAPIRIEARIIAFDGAGERVLASTLPPRICPFGTHDHDEHYCLDAATYFREGQRAIDRWPVMQALDPEVRRMAEHFCRHLRNVAQWPLAAPYKIALGDGRMHLELWSEEALDEKSWIEELVRTLDEGLSDRLERESTTIQQWADESRAFDSFGRLGDQVLAEFLDRLEGDIATLVGVDRRDIWLLVPDETGTSENGVVQPGRLRFRLPDEKLERIQRHYEESASPAIVSNVKHKVDVYGQDHGFVRYLTQCEHGVHQLSWNDEARLTPAHLACIAEKFRGWPTDRGIVATPVQTGCVEVVRSFAEDYRVAAYDYTLRKPADDSAENPQFSRVLRAERVFINTAPHIMELTLLWKPAHAREGTTCGGVLLVLLNCEKHEIANRALLIRGAVEQWYLTFELYARMVYTKRSMQGYLTHEMRSIFTDIFQRTEDLQRKLGGQAWADVSDPSQEVLRNYCDRLNLQRDRLALLEHAFSPDSSLGPFSSNAPLDHLSVADFVSSIRDSALRSAEEPNRKLFKIEKPGVTFVFKSDGLLCSGAECLRVPMRLITYCFHTVFEESLGLLSGLITKYQLDEAERQIGVMVSRDPSQRRICIDFEHAAPEGNISFLTNFADAVCRQIIVDDKGKRHSGMFYMGLLFRGIGGDVRVRVVDARRVQWSFELPLIRDADNTPARRML